MNSKSGRSNYWMKILPGVILLILMMIFMNHVGNSRQASFQETMENSLIVAKNDGDISNYKVEKVAQGLFKCKYKVTVKRGSSSEKDIGIVDTNFLSPRFKEVEFKF